MPYTGTKEEVVIKCRNRYLRRMASLSTADRSAFHRSAFLKKKYGISLKDYERMYLEQWGMCAICGEHKKSAAAGYESQDVLCVDHDHGTGRVRALLCHKCNRGIGAFGDSSGNVENAINYLKYFGR